SDCGAAEMPNEGCRAETNFVACLLQPPANVGIITRLPEDRIEATSLNQSPFIKGHVAPWNMLSLTVGKHHMGRAARRSHDCSRDDGIFRWKQVRTANANEFAAHQITDEIIEP